MVVMLENSLNTNDMMNVLLCTNTEFQIMDASGCGHSVNLKEKTCVCREENCMPQPKRPKGRPRKAPLSAGARSSSVAAPSGGAKSTLVEPPSTGASNSSVAAPSAPAP
ncbi:hypothetical protein Ancab_018938 [Ancistrocladus abbreviatus]